MESEPGEGATFSFALPEAGTPEPQAIAHTSMAYAGRRKPSETRKGHGKKILIADDEPNIVVSLEFLMQRNGYEVSVAGDGEAALGRQVRFRPDLILLDIMLPPSAATRCARRFARIRNGRT